MAMERTEPLKAEQFTTARSAQPRWYRATNRVGGLLPRFGDLHPERLFAQARKVHSGLGDAKPETVAALEALTSSLREDATLSFLGRIGAKMDCGRMAEQHLLIERELAERPEIRETELPPVIFHVGWMRTGSTYTHRLWAADPANRTVPYFESMFPVPPRQGPDDRLARCDALIAKIHRVAPAFEAIHPTAADAPEECVPFFSNVFRSPTFNVQYRIPSYIDWLLKQDARIGYGQYREQLQIMHFHRPRGDRLVLKDPTHSVFLPAILELFPNARFVFTHRDPVVSLSSMCSLYAYTRAVFSDDVDPKAIGPELIESYLPASLGSALEVLDSLAPGRVAHVLQRETRTDPVGSVERAYAQLGMELDDAGRAGIVAFIEADRRGPKHVHRHSIEAFGLRPEAVRERLASYCQRFDV